MSSYAREMTVSHRQKRWKSAMSKDGHAPTMPAAIGTKNKMRTCVARREN